MIFKNWLKPERPKAIGERMNKKSLITVYIVLYVIKEMREQLGLEATLEYAGKYMKRIEKHNPKIGGFVSEALTHMDVEQMYQEAVT